MKDLQHHVGLAIITFLGIYLSLESWIYTSDSAEDRSSKIVWIVIYSYVISATSLGVADIKGWYLFCLSVEWCGDLLEDGACLRPGPYWKNNANLSSVVFTGFNVNKLLFLKITARFLDFLPSQCSGCKFYKVLLGFIIILFLFGYH